MKLGNLLGREGQKELYQVTEEKKGRLPDLTEEKKLQLFAVKDLSNEELAAYLKVFPDFRKEYFATQKEVQWRTQRQIFLLQRQIARDQNLVQVQLLRKKEKQTYLKEVNVARREGQKPQLSKSGVPFVEHIPKEWKSTENILS